MAKRAYFRTSWKYKHLNGQRQYIKILDHLLEKEMGCKPQPYVVFGHCSIGVRKNNYHAFVRDGLMTQKEADECKHHESIGGEVVIKMRPLFHRDFLLCARGKLKPQPPAIDTIDFISPILP